MFKQVFVRYNIMSAIRRGKDCVMLRVVNLISGGGSTNLAILRAELPGGILHGLVETVAIVSSDPEAKGIEGAKEAGFWAGDIYVVPPASAGSLADNLLKVLNRYRPDYYHQLGWMPLTPWKVIRSYAGFNQHLGPGGKWMYGVRRIYAHMRFCELIGQIRPIPIFCQWVSPEYDAGGIVHVQYADFSPEETPEKIAARLLPIEHQVQIEALRRVAKDVTRTRPVPRIALDYRERALLLRAKEEARDRYPNH